MRFGLVVALCLFLGAGLGIGAAVLTSSDDSSADTATPVSVVETGAETDPVDTDLVDTSRESQQRLAGEFIADWHAFRNASAVVVSSVVRTRPDGTTLEDTSVLVQDETGRLLRSFAGIDGYQGNTAVFCSSATGDASDDAGVTCQELPDAPTRTEALVNELDRLSGLLIGDPPRYRLIRDDDGCWELILTTDTIDAPYGDSTVFCFDPVTGTMERSEKTFSNGIVETIEAQSVRTVVTPEDFSSLLGA